VRQVREQTEANIKQLDHERVGLQRQLRDDHSRLHAAAALSDHLKRVTRLADSQEHVRVAERRLTEIDNELVALRGKLVDETEVARALADFDKLWETLAPREQSRLLELLVERVDYDGEQGRISLTFHASGIKSLTHQLANHQEDAA